jgi:hypothetical protein
MTVPERLSARLVPIQLSLRRAPARNAEVCSNSDYDRDNTRPQIQNGSAFSYQTGAAPPRPLPPALANSKRANWRPLKSHS